MAGRFSTRRLLPTLATLVLAFAAHAARAQEMPASNGSGKPGSAPDRAAATRTFLGLGVMPDKAAAERGEPIYQQNCAFCHGQKARGATGPALITSDLTLADDHGERLAPFLKTGRPEKGMPAFSQLTDQQRTDVAEYLHQQVEDVANRGAYTLPNIVVGNAAKGEAYVKDHCMSCHSDASFAHLASKFRSPDQLQRGWIWPARRENPSLAVTATVRTAEGITIAGRVTKISDFRVQVVSADGQTHGIDRGPGVEVHCNDPLAPHKALANSLKNDDMHNVTAYLETLK